MTSNRRKDSQSSITDYFGFLDDLEPEEQGPETLQVALRGFNQRIKLQDGFEDARFVRTTSMEGDTQDPAVLTTWLRLGRKWCKLEPEDIQPRLADRTAPIQSEPFGDFKERAQQRAPDLEATLSASRSHLLYFQALYLEQLQGAPPKKKLKNALVFLKQLELAFCSLRTTTQSTENDLLSKKGSWLPAEPDKQNKRDTKLQEKLEKVDRMVNQLGFHLGTACREVKLSKPTAKKWLQKRKGDGTLAAVRPNAERFSQEKRCLLAEIKQFIDERQGNTYLADIQRHLLEQKGA